MVYGAETGRIECVGVEIEGTGLVRGLEYIGVGSEEDVVEEVGELFIFFMGKVSWCGIGGWGMGRGRGRGKEKGVLMFE